MKRQGWGAGDVGGGGGEESCLQRVPSKRWQFLKWQIISLEGPGTVPLLLPASFVNWIATFYGRLWVMPGEIEHQWNQPGCKEMCARFLADGLVNHKSTRSSLMQNSQTVARWDGEVLRRDWKMCTIVSVASWSDGSWEKEQSSNCSDHLSLGSTTVAASIRIKNGEVWRIAV